MYPMFRGKDEFVGNQEVEWIREQFFRNCVGAEARVLENLWSGGRPRSCMNVNGRLVVIRGNAPKANSNYLLVHHLSDASYIRVQKIYHNKSLTGTIFTALNHTKILFNTWKVPIIIIVVSDMGCTFWCIYISCFTFLLKVSQNSPNALQRMHANTVIILTFVEFGTRSELNQIELILIRSDPK